METKILNFTNKNSPTYQECLDFFIHFLSRFCILTSEDLKNPEEFWEYCVLHKNDSIVLPGEECPYILFICRGAVKHYTGETELPYIIEFATDGDFSAGVKSFLSQTPSIDGFVSAKDTYGIKISYDNYQRLIKERPGYEKVLKILNAEANKRIRSRLISFQSLDAKGRYELMLIEHPNVFNQFSMGDISNYLGINAATLSRLKKEMDKAIIIND